MVTTDHSYLNDAVWVFLIREAVVKVLRANAAVSNELDTVTNLVSYWVVESEGSNVAQLVFNLVSESWVFNVVVVALNQLAVLL